MLVSFSVHCGQRYAIVRQQLGVPAPIILSLLGHAYALLGDQERAVGMLRGLDQAAESVYVPPEYRALVYLGLGQTEEVLHHLGLAFEERSGAMIYLHVDPLTRGIREHPGFQELVDRVGVARR